MSLASSPCVLLAAVRFPMVDYGLLPFADADRGALIEMYHGSHARYETNSPIRTFVPYTIDNKQYILAAYTCTLLVKIPVSELKSGAKIQGTTIAEMGAGNQPLDMVAYKKNGHEYILMANSSHGVTKLDMANRPSPTRLLMSQAFHSPRLAS